MKLLPIYILCFVSFIVGGSSDKIECYVCDDCTKLDDSLLEFCPPEPQDDSTESTSSEELTTASTEDSDPASEDESTPIPEKPVDPKAKSIARRTSRQANYKAVPLEKSAKDIEPSYHCYTIMKEEDSDIPEQKGCIKVEAKKEPCDVLKEKLGLSGTCESCDQDKCNGSDVLKYSLETFVLVIILDLFYLFQ